MELIERSQPETTSNCEQNIGFTSFFLLLAQHMLRYTQTLGIILYIRINNICIINMECVKHSEIFIVFKGLTDRKYAEALCIQN